MPLSDAVWQMGRIAGMTRGLETGDLSLIADANDDRLQEPYRRALIPDYDAIRDACLDGGAGTLWISGSGSTLMAGTDVYKRQVQDGGVGLLGMDAVVDLLEVRRRAAARLGHLPELVAAGVDLERVDRAVVHRLVADRHVHGNNHDTVTLTKLRRHIRAGLHHDYVLAHTDHDPS